MRARASAALYDAIYGFKDYESESRRLRELIQRHRRGLGDSLLDVGCGTGRHLAWLRRHYAVEGLDIDPGLLDVARRRCPEVPFHEADMVDFDLDRRFGAVICLFGSIGYVKTRERLGRAIASMSRHLEPGGVLALEPWLTTESYQVGRPVGVFVDEPELKLARLNVTAREGGCSVLHFHYLKATPAGVEHFEERHELGLFADADYRAALASAALEVLWEPEGLTGRGLYLGRRRESGR